MIPVLTRILRRMLRRRLAGLIVACALAAILKAFVGFGIEAAQSLPSGPAATSQNSPTPRASHSPAGGALGKLLTHVRVVPSRPHVAGYDRTCGTGHACSFGPAWSDDVDVAGGRNGCNTRDDILTRDLVDVTYRPGTHNCVVVSGHLVDPYTGHSITFSKDKAYEVGIDHMIPLARAWDLGASRWTSDQRRNFANDPRNLLAVSESANSSKGDSGPGEWLPINAAYRCTYIARYLTVAIAYRLPITKADAAAVRLIAPHCSRQVKR